MPIPLPVLEDCIYKLYSSWVHPDTLILIKSFHTISSLSVRKVLKDSKPETQYLDKYKVQGI